MTSPISTEQLKEILDGCEGVTPGPWTRCLHVLPVRDAHIRAEIHGCNICDVIEGTESMRGRVTRADMEANSAHIARLDPDTVAAMATELLAAREVLSAAHKEIDRLNDQINGWDE